MRISDWSSDVCSSDLKRAKFSENAILAASWEYVGNEPYASNCPGMTSRGAARALQIDEKDKSRAIQRAHNPPMQGPAVNGGVSLTPGAYNEIGLDRKSTRLNSSH